MRRAGLSDTQRLLPPEPPEMSTTAGAGTGTGMGSPGGLRAAARGFAGGGGLQTSA